MLQKVYAVGLGIIGQIKYIDRGSCCSQFTLRATQVCVCDCHDDTIKLLH